uniref:Uncharacterized protein n=1 Tax=Aegilops tauschii subsp. strangulata TaxID=200361 RepID=A0A453L244_AEGTS
MDKNIVENYKEQYMMKKCTNQWFASSVPHITSSTMEEEPTPFRQGKSLLRDL